MRKQEKSCRVYEKDKQENKIQAPLPFLGLWRFSPPQRIIFVVKQKNTGFSSYSSIMTYRSNLIPYVSPKSLDEVGI